MSVKILLPILLSTALANAAQFKLGKQTFTVPDGYTVERVAGPVAGVHERRALEAEGVVHELVFRRPRAPSARRNSAGESVNIARAWSCEHAAGLANTVALY